LAQDGQRLFVGIGRPIRALGGKRVVGVHHPDDPSLDGYGLAPKPIGLPAGVSDLIEIVEKAPGPKGHSDKKGRQWPLLAQRVQPVVYHLHHTNQSKARELGLGIQSYV